MSTQVSFSYDKYQADAISTAPPPHYKNNGHYILNDSTHCSNDLDSRYAAFSLHLGFYGNAGVYSGSGFT